jgi:hypothetical protein
MLQLDQISLNVGLPIIEQCVFNFFETDKFAVYEKRNFHDIVLPRQIIHYFAMQCRNSTLAKVGRLAGHKNHATVIHSRNLISDAISQDFRGQVRDKDIQRQIAFISRKIEMKLVKLDMVYLLQCNHAKRIKYHIYCLPRKARHNMRLLKLNKISA